MKICLRLLEDIWTVGKTSTLMVRKLCQGICRMPLVSFFYKTYLDANNSGNMENRSSDSGIIVYVNNVPIDEERHCCGKRYVVLLWSIGGLPPACYSFWIH